MQVVHKIITVIYFRLSHVCAIAYFGRDVGLGKTNTESVACQRCLQAGSKKLCGGGDICVGKTGADIELGLCPQGTKVHIATEIESIVAGIFTRVI